MYIQSSDPDIHIRMNHSDRSIEDFPDEDKIIDHGNDKVDDQMTLNEFVFMTLNRTQRNKKRIM